MSVSVSGSTFARAAWVAAALATAALPHVARSGQADPFAFFGHLVRLDRSDRERLDRGDVLVRVLPAHDGELAVFAASRLEAPAEALVSWTREIEQLKTSRFAPLVRRFSNPPVLDDLRDLALDETDMQAIRQCRVGRCDVKLLDSEIARLRAAGTAGGAEGYDATQHEFRRIVLDRVLADRSPDIVDMLAGYPPIEVSTVESFFYWSKEQYGAGKKVVTVTHVTIARPVPSSGPAVVVLGREIFATHYRTASLGLTAVVDDRASDRRYLVYVNRTDVDVLGGLFGGLKRVVIEARIKGESEQLIKGVRDRLESGLRGEVSS